MAHTQAATTTPGRSPQGKTDSRCVGREQELDRAVELLQRARAGQGSLLVLGGSAGIGKTTLLSALRQRLDATGTQVLEGRCQPGLSAYQPLLDLAGEALGALTRDGLDDEALGRYHHALRTLAGRGEPRARVAGEPRTRRISVFDRVAQLFRAAAQKRPLVLLIHDLHLADGETADLVRFLCRVLASRPELRSAPFRGFIVVGTQTPQTLLDDDLLREEVELQTMELEPLDEGGVRAYLSSQEVVQRVLRTTGGVPRQLDAMLLERSAPPSTSPLAGLAPRERQVLQMLAVIGRPIGPEALCTLLDLADAPLARAVARLSRDRLLTKSVTGGTIQVSFARAGDQTGVYEGLDAEDRAALHRQVGAFLRDQGDAQLETAAEHLLLGQAGEEAVGIALRAGQRLERSFCFAKAETVYRRALEQTDQERRRTLLLERICSLCEATGALDRALDAARELQRLHPKRPDLPLLKARLHLLANDHREANRCLERLRRWEGVDRDELQALKLQIEGTAAWSEYLHGRVDQAQRSARQTLDAVERADEEQTGELLPLRIKLQNVLAHTYRDQRKFDEALELAEATLALARAAERPGDELRAAILIGSTQMERGDYPAAEAAIREAAQLADALGDISLGGICRQHLGVLAERRHRYSEAMEHYQAAVSVWKKTGNRTYLAWVALDLGKLYLEMGDSSRAELMVSLVQKLDRGQLPAGALVNRDLLRGRLLQQGQRSDGAEELFRRALARAEESGNEERVTRCQLALVGLLHHRGDAEAAMELFERSIALPRGGALLAAALLERAQLELALGRLDGAGETLDRLRRQIDGGGEGVDAWQVYFLLSRWADQMERPRQARRWLDRAAELEQRALEQIPEDLLELAGERPLRAALRRAREEQRLRRAVAAAGESAATADPAEAAKGGSPRWRRRYRRIVGEHPSLLQVLQHVERVAPTDTTVLIRGESGTGKELVARAVHRSSERARRPLVTVNCGALVESLLLSELFGHERGAFTGASQRKAGRFEVADGGTIFLDEIGDVSPRTQAALLRVLQEREFERVGGTRPLRVDVRVICATNRDLEAMVARGEFRQDLYYRLRGVQLHLPPLRRRVEDLPLLSRHFLARIAEERGAATQKTLTAEAEALLQSARWPGNIRELENVLRSVSLLAESDLLDVEHFLEYPELAELARAGEVPAARGDVPRGAPEHGAEERQASPYQQVREGGLSLKEYKTRIEVACITEAMRETNGNITRAAKLLGMKRPRLSQLVKEHAVALDRADAGDNR